MKYLAKPKPSAGDMRISLFARRKKVTSEFLLARLTQHNHDYILASVHLQKSIQIYKNLERETYFGFCLTQFAYLAIIERSFQRAARSLGAAHSFSSESYADYPSNLIKDYDSVEAPISEPFSKDNYRQAFQTGAGMSVDRAIEYALGRS